MNRAYTLTELLVVIALIACIAAVLGPPYVRGKEQTCASIEKHIGMAMEQYLQDNDGTFPPMGCRATTTAWHDTWWERLRPYAKSWSLEEHKLAASTNDIGMPVCPLAFGSYRFPYAVNRALFPSGNHGKIRLDQVDDPVGRVMLVEVGQTPTLHASVHGFASVDYSRPYFDPAEANFTDSVHRPDTHNNARYDFDCSPISTEPTCTTTSGPSPADMPRFRHAGRCNMLYCDGHVKSVKRGSLDWYKNIYIKGVYETLPGCEGGPR